MSRIRRRKRQYMQIRLLLAHHKWVPWKRRAAHFAAWFLFTHRGYVPGEEMTTEVDMAVNALLRWALSASLVSPWRIVRAAVAW